MAYIKTYLAGAAINARRFVKRSAAGTVILCTAATDKIVGGTTELAAAASGDRVDVVHMGEEIIEAGAAFSFGDLLTSDGSGRAIVAAPGAGTNNRIGAMALEDAAAAGDLVRVMYSPQQVQG